MLLEIKAGGNIQSQHWKRKICRNGNKRMKKNEAMESNEGIAIIIWISFDTAWFNEMMNTVKNNFNAKNVQQTRIAMPFDS